MISHSGETEEVKTDAAPAAEESEVEIDIANYKPEEKAKPEENKEEGPALPVDEDRLYESK